MTGVLLKDVDVVRHGYWHVTPNPFDGEDVTCSVCGKESGSPVYDYCPWCGAKMDCVDPTPDHCCCKNCKYSRQIMLGEEPLDDTVYCSFRQVLNDHTGEWETQMFAEDINGFCYHWADQNEAR